MKMDQRAPFEPWPKIPRLYREVCITEKIDGTNAAVYIEEYTFGTNVDTAFRRHDCAFVFSSELDEAGDPVCEYRVWAQSRTRPITPPADNYGFAKWVYSNAQYLADALGEGRHFGEWWGAGIQRRYGLGEKRFSLFNAWRWEDAEFDHPQLFCVPVIYKGEWYDGVVSDALDELRSKGSLAAPGFDRPEGIVIHHRSADQAFKVTLENDGEPKTVAVKPSGIAALRAALTPTVGGTYPAVHGYAA